MPSLGSHRVIDVIHDKRLPTLSRKVFIRAALFKICLARIDFEEGSPPQTVPTGTYVAQPEDGVISKGILVIIADASGNSTDPAPYLSLIRSWNQLTIIFYRIIYVYKAMESLPSFNIFQPPEPPFVTNNLKIGAAGFCWGGEINTIPVLLVLAQDDLSSQAQRHHSQAKSPAPEPLIDCAFAAHASYIEVPDDIEAQDDIEAIKISINVAVGDNNSAMKVP
ncbi:hypothetical protein SBOR_8267 [Sclerotinia borealis F-4128]|uniref:Dienelactone hydrolase domain-containing protein n=1 Tax=Sclerotinia borealis (strain F-4128) TaxID=1432307 RepID=W9C930_SCLBF|nr:hypothetical protein SBOR_8267 [Sclerotinia borealis F-4128]